MWNKVSKSKYQQLNGLSYVVCTVRAINILFGDAILLNKSESERKSIYANMYSCSLIKKEARVVMCNMFF